MLLRLQKIELGKGNGERQERSEITKCLISVNLIERAFEQKLEGGESRRYVDIWGKSVPSRGNSLCKDSGQECACHV